MPNGDGECKFCGAPGTPEGFDHKEDCSVLQEEEYWRYRADRFHEDDDYIALCAYCGKKPGIHSRKNGKRFEVSCACGANRVSDSETMAVRGWNEMQKRTEEEKMKKNEDWDKTLHDNHAEMGGDNEVDWEGKAIPIEEERELVEKEKEIVDELYPDKAYADIAHRFTYHPPKGDQPHRYNYLRQQAYTLAIDILRNCPESRERSLALTKLEEAIMWANASIARNE